MALHFLGVATAFRERARDTGAGFRFPLPAQAAAIAALVAKTPAAELPTVLSAVNSPDVRVALISASAPSVEAGEQAERIAPVELAIKRYADTLKPLNVAVYLVADADTRPTPRRFYIGDQYVFSDLPLRMDITLGGGRLLRIETRGDLTRRIWGWPLGLMAGAIALLIALFAVRAMWREIRSLPELASRVDRFARAARPQLMPENGPEEIRSVIAAFNRMQTRIAELVKARSVMLGALGHDLRTYLTRLRLRAELVDNAQQQERMIRDLDAMESVIAACTTLARLEGAPLETLETGLAPIFGRLAEAHPSLRVAPAAAKSEVVVWGDRDAIHLALDNLIGNAFRHGRVATEAQPEVEIALRVEDDPLGASDPKAVVSVMDRGPGLEEGASAKLFDAFVRRRRGAQPKLPWFGAGFGDRRRRRPRSSRFGQPAQSPWRRHGGATDLARRLLIAVASWAVCATETPADLFSA